MYCPNCGKEQSNNVKFCPFCGYHIGDEKNKKEIKQIKVSDKLRKHNLRYALVIFCLLAVIMFGWNICAKFGTILLGERKGSSNIEMECSPTNLYVCGGTYSRDKCEYFVTPKGKLIKTLGGSYVAEDGTIAYKGYRPGPVHIYRKGKKFDIENAVNDFMLCKSGKKLAYLIENDDRIYIYDLETGEKEIVECDWPVNLSENKEIYAMSYEGSIIQFGFADSSDCLVCIGSEYNVFSDEHRCLAVSENGDVMYTMEMNETYTNMKILATFQGKEYDVKEYDLSQGNEIDYHAFYIISHTNDYHEILFRDYYGDIVYYSLDEDCAYKVRGNSRGQIVFGLDQIATLTDREIDGDIGAGTTIMCNAMGIEFPVIKGSVVGYETVCGEGNKSILDTIYVALNDNKTSSLYYLDDRFVLTEIVSNLNGDVHLSEDGKYTWCISNSCPVFIDLSQEEIKPIFCGDFKVLPYGMITTPFVTNENGDKAWIIDSDGNLFEFKKDNLDSPIIIRENVEWIGKFADNTMYFLANPQTKTKVSAYYLPDYNYTSCSLFRINEDNDIENLHVEDVISMRSTKWSDYILKSVTTDPVYDLYLKNESGIVQIKDDIYFTTHDEYNFLGYDEFRQQRVN